MKLFIFDLGNVLIKLDPDNITRLAKHNNFDEKELEKDYKYYEIPLMDGTISKQEYFKHLEHVFKVKINVDSFSDHFYFSYNTNVINLVKKLKKNHKVVIGSNTFAPHWDNLIDSDLFKNFNNTYASHILNCSKPYPVFYNTIMQAEGFKAEDTYFIDDLELNINGAKKLGINTFLYSFNDDELSNFLKPFI